MNTKIKKGDIITPLCSNWTYLTKGKEYTVIDIDYDTGHMSIIDDDGDDAAYLPEDFRIVYQNPNDFEFALTLVGESFKIDGKTVNVKAVSVWNKYYPSNNPTINKIVKDFGYCVVLDDGNDVYALTQYNAIDNKVQISDDYTAVIEGDDVVVGCQTISIDKVKEILEIHKQLNA